MMSELEMIFQNIKQLSRDDLEQVYQFVRQQRTNRIWVVPPENLARIAEIVRPLQEDAEIMGENEAYRVLDEALEEVRRERRERQQNSRRD